MSVIDQYCKENAERFNGKACEFDLPPTDECELLKNETRLQTIFDKGRCQPFELVKNIVKAHLCSFKMPQEYDDIVAHVTERVMQQHLKKGATLPVLMGFIKRVAACHIIDKFRQQGKDRKRFVRLVTKSNNDERLTKDEIDETMLTADMPANSAISEKFLLDEMLQALGERTDQEADPKQKFTYKRQEMVFIDLIHLRNHGYSKEDAIPELAHRFNRASRTIYRDIEALEQFLRS